MKDASFRIALSALMIWGATATSASAKTLNIVASFSVLADVVQQIGGSHVQVKGLVGPDGDPHQFEPSPDDARTLKEADLAFISGEGLERWFEKLVTASGYQGTPVIVSTGIKLRERQRKGQISDDPHVWNSPLNVLVWAANIEKALIAADPEAADDFKANAARYSRELRDLDGYAHARIDQIPPQQRKILTSHDAFGYLGRDYGITFLSPLGLSTETEASASHVARLIDQVKAEHVKFYFIETSNDPRLVQQIANATGAQPGGKLYAEALSRADGPAPTYARMFRYNIDLLAKAMVPPSN
ncbi:metal ABC transporter solute-binding protein, Zn/Mn family [Bradyrhizobium sp. WSM3983]|uniref:metal ABC transporter solute-binding protein, Zn/Mn family n=1 Tax=Bradyrhizobium sp. WSM3983 TaxID=1038867 RepID=UPI00041357A3